MRYHELLYGENLQHSDAKNLAFIHSCKFNEYRELAVRWNVSEKDVILKIRQNVENAKKYFLISELFLDPDKEF